jgi:hypothetical protein
VWNSEILKSLQHNKAVIATGHVSDRVAKTAVEHVGVANIIMYMSFVLFIPNLKLLISLHLHVHLALALGHCYCFDYKPSFHHSGHAEGVSSMRISEMAERRCNGTRDM